MLKVNLNGTWRIKRPDDARIYAAQVPGTVSQTLLQEGAMPDPYVRDNEMHVQEAFDHDYIFSREFFVDDALMAHAKVLLRLEGLDTLAELSLNGCPLGEADNMHRTWEFDLKPHIVPGENTLSVLFHSATKYIAENPPPFGRPFTTLRKAACMFGWDWGLCLPDMGIWRNVEIIAFDARIRGAQIRQTHADGRVRLTATPALDGAETDDLEITLTAPGGDVIAGDFGTFDIENPALWWPIGHGAQPLYTIGLTLKRGGKVLDTRSMRVGLRTITLNQAADEIGFKYEFIVNGQRVFFRGENLIIDDAMLRTDSGRTRALIDACVRSNLNGVRVWGGAFYPQDEFYDLCDEKGLLVYQDFMFACSLYGLNESLAANIRREAEDNLSRIAHHACLALLCGNNEIDSILTVAASTDPETLKLRALFGGKELSLDTISYLRGQYNALFNGILKEVSAHLAPEVSYVHSSPSSASPSGATSFYDYLKDGDMHYYLQYDSNAPYQKMRAFTCRFMTEIGFQSYPSMKTLRTFADEADLGPATDIMYAHQKCKNGNEAIEIYMARDYLVPEDFSDYVYLSQLQAGRIMQYSTEHLRRQSAVCAGVILWQLNDCWPVVSWSGIDYFGRWKALQYFIRRFFAPILVSDVDGRAIHVSNDTPNQIEANITWSLCRDGEGILRRGAASQSLAPGESREVLRLDFTEEETHGAYLVYKLDGEPECVSLFTIPKDYPLRKPALSVKCFERTDEFIIQISTDCLAMGVALDIEGGDALFSDNFFDLPGGAAREITIKRADATGIRSLMDLQEKLTVRTLNQVMTD